MTISRRWGNKISRKTVPRPWRTPKRGYLHGPLRSQSNCTHPSRRRCRGSARSTKECRESALAARVARAQLQDLQNEIVALQERVRPPGPGVEQPMKDGAAGQSMEQAGSVDRSTCRCLRGRQACARRRQRGYRAFPRRSEDCRGLELEQEPARASEPRRVVVVEGRTVAKARRHRRGHRSLVGRSWLPEERSRHRRGHRRPVEWSWSTVVQHEKEKRHWRGQRSLVGRSWLPEDRSTHRRGHRSPVEWLWSTV